jgi:hypothetical protein
MSEPHGNRMTASVLRWRHLRLATPLCIGLTPAVAWPASRTATVRYESGKNRRKRRPIATPLDVTASVLTSPATALGECSRSIVSARPEPPIAGLRQCDPGSASGHLFYRAEALGAACHTPAKAADPARRAKPSVHD